MQKNNRLQKAKLLVGDNEVMTASPYSLRRYLARYNVSNTPLVQSTSRIPYAVGIGHTINGRGYVANASGMLFPIEPNEYSNRGASLRTFGLNRGKTTPEYTMTGSMMPGYTIAFGDAYSRSMPVRGTGRLPYVSEFTRNGYQRGNSINTTRYRGVKADGVVVRPPAKNATTSMRTTSGASSPTAFTPEESSVLDLINQNAKNGNYIDTRQYRGMRTNQSIIRPTTRNRIAPEESNTLLNNLLNQPLRGSASSVVGSPPTSSMGRAVRGATNSAVRSTIGSEIGRKVKPRIIPTVESGVERASRSGLGRKTMRIAGKVWGKLPWWAKLGVGIAGGIGGAYAVDQTVGRILPRKKQTPAPDVNLTTLGKRMSKSMTKSMTTPKIAIKHNNKYL